MKKILKYLVLISICCSSVYAKTNKTFLQSRSNLFNLAMEYTTYGELIMTRDKDRLGTNFQFVPFYQESNSKKSLGRYFGIKEKNSFVANNIPNSDVHGLTSVTGSLNLDYIMHNAKITDDAPAKYDTSSCKIKLAPTVRTYGARIDFYQDFERLIKGLYLKIAVPVIYIKKDMHLDIDEVEGWDESQVYNYFKGDFTGFDNSEGDNQPNRQYGLENSKMGKSKSKTGVPDIDMILGYNIWNTSKMHVALNVGGTIPVSNSASGHEVFEVILGDGKYWGFGCGCDGAVKLWESGKQNIKAALVANYRYLFKNAEYRTIGLKEIDWGQYLLVAKQDSTNLIPATNILTKRVNVKTGGQLDGIINLSYNYSGLTFDLGFDFYWKDAETVYLAEKWHDDVYALAHPYYAFWNGTDGWQEKMDKDQTQWASKNTEASPIIGYNNVTFDNAYKINYDNLNLYAAHTPVQVTFKFYGGLGYIVKNVSFPLMLGVGASYELTDKNSIEQWAAWGKIGIGF